MIKFKNSMIYCHYCYNFKIIYNFVSFVHTVYLSLGSNLGNKLDYIFQAKIFIKSDIGLISQESSLYLSGLDILHIIFINQCVEVKLLEPLELLNKIKIIENLLGKAAILQILY